MNFSQMKDLEYLFNIKLNLTNRIIFKLDGELATANFSKYDENDRALNICGNDFRKQYSIDYRFDNKISEAFYDKFGCTGDEPHWSENPLFTLIILTKYIKEQEVTESESESSSLLYNLHFLNSDKKFKYYFVNDNREFEIISITD